MLEGLKANFPPAPTWTRMFAADADMTGTRAAAAREKRILDVEIVKIGGCVLEKVKK